MINAKAKDQPDFVALMQFVDWLWYSDAGQMFTKWGVEGTTYQLKDGKPALLPAIDFNGLNPGTGKKDLRRTSASPAASSPTAGRRNCCTR